MTPSGPRLRFRILNVFAEESALSGNALAVIEDARGLSDDAMQAIALQFNLSETTFVLPSSVATARVRIFTPSFEMPFAGHPTLGTAHVVAGLHASGGAPLDSVTLETKAGTIPVDRAGDAWTLRARPPASRAPASTRAAIGQTLGLDERDVAGPILWVDTGSEQLVVPLASAGAVDRCAPDARLLASTGRTRRATPSSTCGRRRRTARSPRASSSSSRAPSSRTRGPGPPARTSAAGTS